MAIVSVAGRQIYINTQKTQTVKICDPRNKRGMYEKYYRIIPPYVLQEDQLVQTILRFKDLQELENWLINDRKAVREPQNEATVVSTEVDDDNLSESPDVRGAVAEVLDLLNADQYSPDADTWLVQAKELVEQSIDRFLGVCPSNNCIAFNGMV